MQKSGGLNQFVKMSRAKLTCSTGAACRIVMHTEIGAHGSVSTLAQYVADRAPFFYRSPETVAESITISPYFHSMIRATLAKLPTAKTFKESHFGEIAAGIFAEEILGLQLLYSKLSFLSAENANACKMDLVLYDPRTDPVEFVLGEVKSSPKGGDNLPAKHDIGLRISDYAGNSFIR